MVFDLLKIIANACNIRKVTMCDQLLKCTFIIKYICLVY
jgi:hypothetical protein